jgi:scaffold protein (connect acetoacetyl-CoA thiolase and HMG-CoA synthase)
LTNQTGIAGKKCNSCGYTYFYRVDNCSRCGNQKLEPVKYGGEGKVYSFTTVYVPPLTLKDEAPYVVAIVDLAEGPRVTARLNLPASEIKIGKEVVCTAQNSTCLVFS